MRAPGDLGFITCRVIECANDSVAMFAGTWRSVRRLMLSAETVLTQEVVDPILDQVDAWIEDSVER